MNACMNGDGLMIIYGVIGVRAGSRRSSTVAPVYRGVTKVLTAAYGNYLQHITHFIHNLLKCPLNIIKLGLDVYIVE